MAKAKADKAPELTVEEPQDEPAKEETDGGS